MKSASLRKWLYSQDTMSLLPGFGWLDGGCLTLALALTEWAKKSEVPASVAIFYRENGSPDHFLAIVPRPRCSVYIDGDGFASEAGVVHKMAELEGVDGYVRQATDAELLQIRKSKHFWENENTTSLLAQRLQKQFGPLCVPLLRNA